MVNPRDTAGNAEGEAEEALVEDASPLDLAGGGSANSGTKTSLARDTRVPLSDHRPLRTDTR